MNQPDYDVSYKRGDHWVKLGVAWKTTKGAKIRLDAWPISSDWDGQLWLFAQKKESEED